MKEQIREALEKMQVILQEDGGNVQFVDYTEDKVVKVLLQGHCAECPFSQMTVKTLIEGFLKEEFGEAISAVEAIN